MPDRTRSLLDAGIALASELSLDSLLQKLVETAAELTGARYAALGVIDAAGRELERFITTGLDPETYAAIGELPRGRGILGALIAEARPLRLDTLQDDPRSVGFPEHHPNMSTFLGVPILLRGRAYGNLYLTEKEGGSFTDEDEEVVSLLAAQAAVAIENARLYEAATRWSAQLESLVEVGNALAREVDPPSVLSLVASRLRELIQARLVGIVLPTPEGDLRVESAEGQGAAEFVGTILGQETSKAGRVLERRIAERVDSMIEDPEVDREVARRLGAHASLYAPMLVRGEAIGVIVAFDKLVPDRRFTNEDQRVAEIFAARAAVAVDQGRRIERSSLRRVLGAQELERRRLARELHDETGQALTSILLGLRSVEEAKDEGALHSAAASLRELVVQTLHDVRRLAVELRPKALDDFGLEPALDRLVTGFAEQTGLAVELESRLGDERLPPDLETALYRIVQEALTNVVKHARAERVSIILARKGTRATVVIEDDGQGFDPDAVRDGGIGLLGMRERVELLDGRLVVESSEGTGTTLVVEVPVL